MGTIFEIYEAAPYLQQRDDRAYGHSGATRPGGRPCLFPTRDFLLRLQSLHRRRTKLPPVLLCQPPPVDILLSGANRSFPIRVPAHIFAVAGGATVFWSNLPDHPHRLLAQQDCFPIGVPACNRRWPAMDRFCKRLLLPSPFFPATPVE